MKTLLLILCIMGHGLYAQTIERHTFSNAGRVINADGTYWQLTVGEPIIGLTGSGTSLDQGFWATLGSDITLGTNPVFLESPELVVYPNPVSDFLTIKMNHTVPYKVTIYNVLNQKVLEETMSSGTIYSQVNLNSLSGGNYVVILSIPELQINKIIKIIKN